MTDAIDKAQIQSELILEYQIRQATQKTSLPTRTHCIDCDEPIPLLRQQKVAGCQRCVACQTQFENRKAKGA
ncbi:MAG: TraR/DksA C4-type zinc finger protein [Moraxella sp.]|nr:TraR/DksA C4-type zinc finger protein [Moraxella sp.]